MKTLVRLVAASLCAALLAACAGNGLPANVPQSAVLSQMRHTAVSNIRASWSLLKIAGMYSPTGIALDLVGNVYVASYQRGTVTTIAKNGTKTIVATGLGGPFGIALYNGYMYVAEREVSRVVKIAPNGRVTQIGRTWAYPNDVAVDRAGNLYVTDSGLGVFKVARNGSIIQLQPRFDFGAPYGVAVADDGTVYVTSVGNDAVYEIPPQGPIVSIGSGWNSPFGVVVGKTGAVFVANFEANEITEIQGGKMTQIRGRLGFGRPLYLTTDKSGDVFVTSHGKKAVFKLTPG